MNEITLPQMHIVSIQKTTICTKKLYKNILHFTESRKKYIQSKALEEAFQGKCFQDSECEKAIFKC